MAQWSDWTPDVAIDVPGCPVITLERAIKLTVIDFLERSHWLQRTVAPIDITGGAGVRAFASPVIATGERVLAVKKAWINGAEIHVYGPGDVEDDQPDWKTATGSPTAIVMERDDGYYIVPAPTSTMTAALQLKVAIGLLETATACDDSIRVEWRDCIAAGAKARLMFMPDRKWTSPELGAGHQSVYNSGVGSAQVRAVRTPARRPLTIRPYFF